MSFISLLIHTCSIQAKTLNRSGYEKTETWSDIATGVATRHDSSNGVKISDGGIRINTDDDLFFFEPTVTIARGNRIVHDGINYDVIKVNKLYAKAAIHHLEVVARATDNK